MKVFAVVPTFRRPDVARRCVEGLLAQTRPPDRIIVVENTPEPELVDAFGSPAVEVVHPGWNTGAAGGFGIGADVAVEQGATHVLFVDDDCLLEQHTIERLLVHLPYLRDAALGPVVTSDGETLVWEVYRPDGRPYRCRSELPGHPIPTRSFANHGLLVSADAIRRLGGPRKDLFFGGEDVEFCMRLAAGGIRLFYCPDAWAMHHPLRYRRFWFFGWRQVVDGSPGHRYYVLRNRLILWRLHHRDSPITGVVRPIAAEFLGLMASTSRLRRARLLMAAVRDGLLRSPSRTLRNDVPLHDGSSPQRETGAISS